MVKSRILIADAHTLTREGLNSLLAKRRDIQVCGVEKDSPELLVKLNIRSSSELILYALNKGIITSEDKN